MRHRLLAVVALTACMTCLTTVVVPTAAFAQSPSDKAVAREFFSGAYTLKKRGYALPAAMLFEYGLSKDPRNHAAHYLLAETYDGLADTAMASQHYAEVIRLAPQSAEASKARVRLAGNSPASPGQSSPAAASVGQWLADTNNSCQVWAPAPKPEVTVTWSGPCRAGKANGIGILQWYTSGSAGTRYEGEYRDGKANGRGVVNYWNGNRYEGEFRDGKFHGTGEFAFTNGTRHKGEYREGRPNGRGVMTYSSGTRYEGEFRDGKFNGAGALIFANGTRDEGEFSDGKLVRRR